jgi:hypothetical protein
MRLAELEEMMSEEPGEAEAAIAELVASSNVEELSRIARLSRTPSLSELAAEGLAEVGGPAASAALIEMLEAVKPPFLEGGTDQRRQYEAKQRTLVRAVARVNRVPEPAVRTQRDIEAFIESCREG